MCVSCSRIMNKKRFVTWHCVSFVDRFIAAFCCSLWTGCRRTGSQSSCASNHRKLVDKAVCLAVGRHGRRVSDAIVVFHIVLTIWEGHSLYYLLPFVNRLRISRLESSVRTACFLFPAYYTPFTLYARSLLTMRTCYDEFSQRARKQLYVILVIKLLIFIIMTI